MISTAKKKPNQVLILSAKEPYHFFGKIKRYTKKGIKNRESVPISYNSPVPNVRAMVTIWASTWEKFQMKKVSRTKKEVPINRNTKALRSEKRFGNKRVHIKIYLG